MGQYARGTVVPVDQSQKEIKKLIGQAGASSFMYGETLGAHVIGFEFKRRQIKMIVTLPKRENFKFEKGSSYRTRSESKIDELMAQEERRLWRCLVLMVKAKFESISSGVATFDSEFLAYTVLPGGRTVAQELLPKLEAMYAGGEVPQLLRLGSGE